jgi:hypothetical protein
VRRGDERKPSLRLLPRSVFRGAVMVLSSPVKRLARRAVKGALEKAGLAGLTAVAVAAAALLLLVCAASLRCSAVFGSALAAAPRKLWAGGVSIAAEASAAAAEEARRKVAREECDLFDGKWVWDDAYPLYESPDCPFLDVGFRCSENGRPDSSYTKWRWQPARCDLPRLVLVPACSTGGCHNLPFPFPRWIGMAPRC